MNPDADRRAKGFHGLALGWLKRGRVKQAVISLQNAIATDENYLEGYLELGRVFIHLRRWRDLVELCRRGLKYRIESSELHKMMIAGITELGSLDDAFDWYRLERRDQNCLDVGPEDILACVAVRNEKARLSFFLRYYRKLGVDRFFFIDNGSTDGSLEYLLEQPDVHVWLSDLSFKQANFGSSWFELLLKRHGTGHWCLLVDIDEFLLFDGAPERGLRSFCRDLERREKQVATGLLLDMYSDRPVRETVCGEGQDPLSVCCFFDREFCHRRYESGGQYRNQTIFFGGVRQRVFSAEHDFLLSKAPLLKYGPNVVLASGQHLTNIAPDFVAAEEVCLLHFKFLSGFPEYARAEAEREVHAMYAEQYKSYWREIGRNQDLCLFDSDLSVGFEGPDQLKSLGILRAGTVPPSTDIPAIAVPASPAGQRPFWSVMITVFDRVRYLEEAISGVLQQADDDIQIEVVCDYSSAEQQEAVRQRAARAGGARVSFFPLKEHAGHPRIFNLCIERARGEWVHILHDDDRMEPGFYEALRKGIEEHPEAGAAFSRHVIVDKGPGEPTVWRSWLERETPGILDDWLRIIAVECRVQFSAMTVKRRVYEELGGFCNNAGSAFDWEMWARIAARYPVFYVPDPLVKIGRDDTAESSRLLRSGEQIIDAFKAVEAMRVHLPSAERKRLEGKARERVADYALNVARRYLEKCDLEAALANLRAGLSGKPSQDTLRKAADVVIGVDNEFKG
jgi:glycosyltransferase involved in cell wall biosynthesis